MDKEELEYFNNKLISEKRKHNSVIKQMMSSEIRSINESRTRELSTTDNHPADMATEMFDQEKNLSLIDNEKRIVKNIDSALERIKDGSYGVCERCGKPIADERLKCIPYAAYCIDCEHSVEDMRPRIEYRQVEEQTLGYPFGRDPLLERGSFMDSEEYNGYDGEDAIEDLQMESPMKDKDEYDYEFMLGTVEPIENISNQQYKNQLP